jgi:hypothetical protein
VINNSGTYNINLAGNTGSFGNSIAGSSFINSGTLVKTNSSGTVSFELPLSNTGIVRVLNGTLSFTGGYTQTAGSLELTGGNLQSTSALQLQGGLLTGAGTINAAIMNNAMLRPALGGNGLNVNGNLSLLTASNLVFQLGGLVQGSQYGYLQVNGSVSLGGQLVLSFVNGFQNSVTSGDTFTLMMSGSAFTGSFTNIASGGRLITSDGVGSFVVNYNGNTLTLSGFNRGSGLPVVTSRWANAANGSWTDGANWDSAPAFPNNSGTATYRAIIDATGAPYQVTLGNPVTIDGFELSSADATLALNSGGVLESTGTSAVNAGTLLMNGGTLRGGTLALNGGVVQVSTSGGNIFDGVTVNGTLSALGEQRFPAAAQRHHVYTGDLTGANTRLLFEGTAATPSSTLNAATVNLDGTNAGFGLSGNMTLTLGATTTVRGRGIIGSDLQFSGLGTLINQGVISADIAGQTLTVSPDVFTNQATAQVLNGATLTISSASWSNSGTLVVNNATLNLDGTFTNPGVINRTGGTINITGVWNNTGNTYALDATTGDFRLNGGRINGGTINQSAAGALRFSTSGSNILDAVTVNGTMQLSENSAFVRLLNGATFTQADLTGSSSRLLVEGTTGSGTTSRSPERRDDQSRRDERRLRASPATSPSRSAPPRSSAGAD